MANRILPFACTCPKCNTVNDIPLEVADKTAIYNDSRFVYICAECKYEVGVKVALVQSIHGNNDILH